MSSGHVSGFDYDQFFFPNSRALLPMFRTNCLESPRWVSFCPDGVSLCSEHHHQPFLLSPHKPLSGICTHPKTSHFLAWTWKWAKWTTVWAMWYPTEQNVWKVGKTFLEVWVKKIHSCFDSYETVSCLVALWLWADHGFWQAGHSEEKKRLLRDQANYLFRVSWDPEQSTGIFNVSNDKHV